MSKRIRDHGPSMSRPSGVGVPASCLSKSLMSDSLDPEDGVAVEVVVARARRRGSPGCAGRRRTTMKCRCDGAHRGPAGGGEQVADRAVVRDRVRRRRHAPRTRSRPRSSLKRCAAGRRCGRRRTGRRRSPSSSASQTSIRAPGDGLAVGVGDRALDPARLAGGAARDVAAELDLRASPRRRTARTRWPRWRPRRPRC